MEMMLVVGLMGMLLAMAVLALALALARSTTGACVNKLRHIESAKQR